MKVEEFVWMVKNSELQHSLLPEEHFQRASWILYKLPLYMYLGVYLVNIFQKYNLNVIDLQYYHWNTSF